MEKNVRSTELHPLGFFLPANAKILLLGSFPPPKNRWSMNFYYPNIQNDMWRIMGILFFENKEYFLGKENEKAFDEARVRSFCEQQGIALGDTAAEVIRLKENASDKFLEVVTPSNIPEVLAAIPDCKAVSVTGQKAMDTLLSVIKAIEPRVGEHSTFSLDGTRELFLYRMPSSSRAYPKAIEEKAADYGRMFREIGLLK